MTQDTFILKDKTGPKEGSALEITKSVEDSGDNSLQADANSREPLENDFEVILSEEALWDEEDQPPEIRLFEDNIYDESDEKELTLSTEEAKLPDEASKSRSQETAAEAKLPDESSWIIWTITGVSGLLLTLGLVLLWNLSVPFLGPHSAVTEDIPDTLANHGDFKTMELDPFLIPAQRDKEMIFLKLQVELIVPDAETKHAIREKEAWVRDTISRELKGIDISSGMQKNFLMQYRQPIVRCLNQELAPLRVEDIRLKGYLIK